jgi:hypothetical protein
MWLRLFVPRRRGRAGLGRLRPRWPLAGVLLATALLAGCGGSRPARSGGQAPPSTPPAAVRGPSFGLTEDNAQLLADPPASPSAPTQPGDARFVAARERLAALHPEYVRLLIDWAALQPDPQTSPSLQAPSDGCARELGPCAGYDGIAAELAALAARQRAASAEGRGGYQVVLDVLGVPAWAARAPSGCEPAGAQPSSRPINAAGLAGYRALIRSLLALGVREGVALSWWSPWNEPNNARFLSPQRAACADGSPSLAPAVYAQLAQAMAETLDGAGGVHHLLLGELAGYETSSPLRTSVAEFVASLPTSVVCLSGDWSIHAYASYGTEASSGEPVTALASALAKRGTCGRAPRIWVTEAGAGAPHPGRPRPDSPDAEREGCLALGAQLERWAADAQVEAVFQYTFRDDPDFPVGLLSADLASVHLDYRLWLLYTRARARGEALVPPALLCA